jgi:hypothetical protein
MAMRFETSGWRAVIAEHLADRVAETRGLPPDETPVGFKLIGRIYP